MRSKSNLGDSASFGSRLKLKRDFDAVFTDMHSGALLLRSGGLKRPKRGYLGLTLIFATRWQRHVKSMICAVETVEEHELVLLQNTSPCQVLPLSALQGRCAPLQRCQGVSGVTRKPSRPKNGDLANLTTSATAVASVKLLLLLTEVY